MKICVIGCGAVGSLFAAHLAKAGEAEVWAYDVWKEHVEAIQKNGLRISGAAELTARLNAASDPKQLPRCDYGIVATKAIAPSFDLLIIDLLLTRDWPRPPA